MAGLLFQCILLVAIQATQPKEAAQFGTVALLLSYQAKEPCVMALGLYLVWYRTVPVVVAVHEKKLLQRLL